MATKTIDLPDDDSEEVTSQQGSTAESGSHAPALAGSTPAPASKPKLTPAQLEAKKDREAQAALQASVSSHHDEHFRLVMAAARETQFEAIARANPLVRELVEERNALRRELAELKAKGKK
jgi:hypothetical protein